MLEKVIIFGIGMKLEELKLRDALSNFDIIAYSDNNIEMFGKTYNGKKVICPSEICNYNYDAIYISTEQYYDAIEKQLIEQYNVRQNKIKHFSLPKDKYEGEITFWKALYKKAGNTFENEHYRNRMLSIAGEQNDAFWGNKVVVDFGCGPAGSLTWTKTPAVKIGIDVLAERYLRAFGEDIVKQDMIYVTSSEEKIPMPDQFADYLITINSLDHVDNLDMITSELLRILKKDGILLASFNINELSTECEPQILTEKKLYDKFLKYFEIKSYRLEKTGRINKEGEEQAVLYVKGIKNSGYRIR